MLKLKLEKAELNQKEKRKVGVCIALLFLCVLISAGFAIYIFSRPETVDMSSLSTAFLAVYSAVFAIMIPSAVVFSNTMKHAKAGKKEEQAQVQDILASKKGFTLVELTVVLAVSALVVTMVVGFMITFQQHSLKLADRSQAVIDVNSVKDCVEDFILNNDKNENVKFTVSSSAVTAGSASLKFDRDTQKLGGKVLETVSDCRFSVSNGVLVCTVKVKNGRKRSDSTTDVTLKFSTFLGSFE